MVETTSIIGITMQNQNIQTLKGFRDFLPAEKRKRDYVTSKVKEAFELYGFEPIETPTLEYASLLLGKYGDEADKLIYSFQDRGERQIALRYDQTVPTARVLVQYQSQLPRYFRRYQIQNVFRADKPQKGRYREFTQCDCDIFNSTDPLADAELLAVFAQVYRQIGFKSFVIEVNDRQTLMSTLESFATAEVSVFSIIQTIDKLDKMTAAEVSAELVNKGLTEDMAKLALDRIAMAEPSAQLQTIMMQAEQLGVPKEWLKFNPALARGLDYYTGLIFEGKVLGADGKATGGSVGGGGRYDKLIGELSGTSIPAVGFAMGFDRTVEAADELGLIPVSETGVQILVAMFDEKTVANSLKLAFDLRQAGIATEVYPSVDKLTKQFKLADTKRIPYVAMIGEQEANNGVIAFKNMRSGEQTECSFNEMMQALSQ